MGGISKVNNVPHTKTTNLETSFVTNWWYNHSLLDQHDLQRSLQPIDTLMENKKKGNKEVCKGYNIIMKNIG